MSCTWPEMFQRHVRVVVKGFSVLMSSTPVGQHGRAGHGRGASRRDLPGGSEASRVCLSVFFSCLPDGPFNIFANKLHAAQAFFSPRNMLSLTLSVG
jgi:hypothetical protein